MTPDSTTNESRKRHGRPFPWRCFNCLKEEVYPATTPYAADVKHDGRLHHIEIPELTIPKCRACGEVVFNYDADDQIMAALRSHLNLLTPEQIKAGRKALGLKSKELARRLGVADATVSRWEKKMMIQSRAMDNLLRAYFAVPEVRAFLGGSNKKGAPDGPAVPDLSEKAGQGKRGAKMTLEEEFHKRMERLHCEANDNGLIGKSSRFSGMVQQHGGKGAVERLLAAKEVHSGVTDLWLKDQDGTTRLYEYTCEYVILHEAKWRPLFDKTQLDKAYKWLTDLWPNVSFPKP